MSGRLFVTEADVADTRLLGITCQVSHRDTYHAEDVLYPIHFQGIDQEVHPVGKGCVGIIFYISHSCILFTYTQYACHGAP